MSDRRPNAIDRILRVREVEHRGMPMEQYKAFATSEGRPQMSFSICRIDGSLDGFLYHNLDNVSLVEKFGQHFLSFGHRGKVVTISGKNLEGVFHAMMGHTLMEIHEHRGSILGEAEPVVLRVEITHLA